MKHVAFVRAVFAIVFVLLLVPAKLMAWAHGPTAAEFAGATVSTLLVWWFLYRLCVRAEPKEWFVAASVPALYMAVFSAPLYAWGALLLLYVVHRFVRGHVRDSREDEAAADQSAGSIRESATLTGSTDGRLGFPRIDVIDLDPISAPYRRILLSLRANRAAVASLAGSVLLTGPAVASFATYDAGEPTVGVIAGVALTTFLVIVAALYLAWLRAVWTGSVSAARLGAAVSATVATVLVATALTSLRSELFATGTIWYHAFGYFLQLIIVAALGAASMIVMRGQGDETLMSMLRQNARHSWRDAILHLCGIVLPRRRSISAVVHRSVVLSSVAFCLEGTAFYVYFKAGTNVLNAGELLTSSGSMLSPFPGRLTGLEAHYLAVVTIAALLLPILYVSTQVTLTLADRLRQAARRAAVRSAEDLLAEDERAPILFLRDFEDDQVSLQRASLPGWARVADPGFELANLEDVLQAYSTVGPLIAIGRPEDVRPPVGAARRYIRGSDWQSVVLSLMDAASAIVVGVSDSPGLVWEIDQLRDPGRLRKSVFVLPPTRVEQHDLLSGLVGRLLPPSGSASTRSSAVPAVGPRQVVGVVVREEAAAVFVTKRKPSQVELDVLLRLTMPNLVSHAGTRFAHGSQDDG